MVKKEVIIVSFTTWKPRFRNIPYVLDSIYGQTVKPDKVVLNLAYDEVIPLEVSDYINQHDIEIYRTTDTKVYKKFLPTLFRYPEACIINIDDDCIFPTTMIEDFMTIHKQYPQFPISGNKVALFGMQCHCGNASLTKYEYFGEWLNKIDEEVMQNCSSSDIVFSYLAAKNNHPYICSKEVYFHNVMQKSLEIASYTSEVIERGDGLAKTYSYLVNRFGELPTSAYNYIEDKYLADIVDNIYVNEANYMVEEQRKLSEQKLRSSYAFRLGKLLLQPVKWFRSIVNH